MKLNPQWNRDYDQAEAEFLFKVQKEASVASIEQAKKEATFSVWQFSDVMGPQFSGAKLPVTTDVFTKIGGELHVTVSGLKDQYKRLRPPFSPAKVKSLVDVQRSSGSYPSGHATHGFAFALILADLRPDLREQIMDFGRGVGWHRVVLGVHYPTDVIAGYRLGQAIAGVILASAQYKLDRKLILAEWKKAGLLK